MDNLHLNSWQIADAFLKTVDSAIALEKCSGIFLVFGINDQLILRKMLSETDTDLDEVIEIANAWMRTDESLRVFSSKKPTAHYTCRFKNAVCNACRIKGYLQAKCVSHLDTTQSASSGSGGGTHHVAQTTEHSECHAETDRD